MTKNHIFNVRFQQTFDWQAWFDDQLDRCLAVFPSNKQRILTMVDSVAHLAYVNESDKLILKLLRQKSGQKKAKPDDLRNEIRAGAERIMNGEWYIVSRP